MPMVSRTTVNRDRWRGRQRISRAVYTAARLRRPAGSISGTTMVLVGSSAAFCDVQVRTKWSGQPDPSIIDVPCN